MFNSDARINIAVGAVRAGKSFCILLRFLEELRSGPDGEYIVTGKSLETCERNVVTPLSNLAGNALTYNAGRRYFNLLGKKVYVIGANDERSVSKIKGATFAGALVDEVTELPETFFQMLFSRLTVMGSKLFGGTNPDSPYHWLKYTLIDEYPDDPAYLKVFNFTLDDNPSLDPSIKMDLMKKYKGLWYKRFICGEWVQAQGAVYDFFDANKHTVVSPPTYAKEYFLGIDYGTSNPFAAVLVGYNGDPAYGKPEIWVEKEYYWDSKAVGYQKTDAEYGIDIEREFGQYPIQLIYLDPSAASFQTELRRLKKTVKQANNEVLDGIRCVSTLLSEGSLVVCKNCTNLIKEIEGYVWDQKSVIRGEDKPLKQRDHAIDALRYVIFTRFGNLSSIKESNREGAYEKAQIKRYQQNPMAYPGYTNSPGWQRF